MDVDAISPGSDFVAAIEEVVGRCDALIAVIGEKWLTASGESGRRRLDEERDWVRVEIRTALSRGVRVIPTLVENTPMPRPEDLPADLRDLATRNAIRVSHERFADDMERLFDSLSTFVRWYRRTRPLAVARRVFLAVGGLATLVITAWVALRWAAGLPPLAFGQEAIAERWLERQHRETGCVFVGSPQFRQADVVGSPEADLIALYYLEGCGGGNDYSTHLAVFERMGGAIEFVTDAVVGGK